MDEGAFGVLAHLTLEGAQIAIIIDGRPTNQPHRQYAFGTRRLQVALRRIGSGLSL